MCTFHSIIIIIIIIVTYWLWHRVFYEVRAVFCVVQRDKQVSCNPELVVRRSPAGSEMSTEEEESTYIVGSRCLGTASGDIELFMCAVVVVICRDCYIVVTCYLLRVINLQ
jgi:hypothetical protein